MRLVLKYGTSKTCNILSVIIFLGAAVYYWLTIPRWWSGDDTQILMFAARFGPLDYFFYPEIWRQFTPANLTPWIVLSFDIDIHLFGLHPALFYAHQLFIVFSLSLTMYIFLNRFIAPCFSLFTTLVFLFSPPVTWCIPELMTRHYFEGLMWVLLSLIFYLKYIEKPVKLYRYISVTCYAAAVLCKEIYVPLPVLIFLWPAAWEHEADQPGCWKTLFCRHLRMAYPYFVVLFFYIVYRKFMLSSIIGGYGSIHVFSPSLNMISANLFHRLFMGSQGLLMTTALLAVTGLAVTVNNLKIFTFCVAVILCTLPPLLNIINIISERHLLLPIFILTTCTGMGLHGLWNHAGDYFKSAVAAGIIAMLVFVIPAHIHAGQEADGLVFSYERTGKFLWHDSSPGDAVINSAIPNWYFSGLVWLKKHVAHGGLMGQGVSDFCYAVILGDVKAERWWRYDEASREIQRIPEEEILKMRMNCKRSFVKKEIDALFSIDKKRGMVTWRIEPPGNGRYWLVDIKTGYPCPLPRTGSYPLYGTDINFDSTGLNICYEDRKGWRACSRIKISNEE